MVLLPTYKYFGYMLKDLSQANNFTILFLAWQLKYFWTKLRNH